MAIRTISEGSVNSSGFKTGAAKSHLNLAKWAFSKLDPCDWNTKSAVTLESHCVTLPCLADFDCFLSIVLSIPCHTFSNGKGL